MPSFFGADMTFETKGRFPEPVLTFLFCEASEIHYLIAKLKSHARIFIDFWGIFLPGFFRAEMTFHTKVRFPEPFPIFLVLWIIKFENTSFDCKIKSSHNTFQDRSFMIVLSISKLLFQTKNGRLSIFCGMIFPSCFWAKITFPQFFKIWKTFEHQKFI